jgi:hypothetical protein
MFDKYDGSKIFLIGISVAILLIGTFAVSSQFVQQSLAQDSSQMGQDVERNETVTKLLISQRESATHQK